MEKSKNYFYIPFAKSSGEDVAITINNYIGKRCNADLSIKLACDATSWPTYCSLNGQIDAIHDYGTVELDDCVKQYTKKMKTIKEGE